MSGEYDLDRDRFGDVRRGAAEPDIDEETDNSGLRRNAGRGTPKVFCPRASARSARRTSSSASRRSWSSSRTTDADPLTCGYKDEAEALEEFGERVAAGEPGTAVAMGDPNHRATSLSVKCRMPWNGVLLTSPDSQTRQDAVERGGSRHPGPRDSGYLIDPAGRQSRPDADGVTPSSSRCTRVATSSRDYGSLAVATEDERHLLVLPRPYDRCPAISRNFARGGAEPDLEALVLEKLTHDDERIHRFTLGELAEHAGERERRHAVCWIWLVPRRDSR